MGGGLVAVGGVNLGGSIDTLFNACGTVGKGATTILMSVSAGRQLFDMAARLNMVFATKCRMPS